MKEGIGEIYQNRKEQSNLEKKQYLKNLLGSDENFYQAFFDLDQQAMGPESDISWDYKNEDLVLNKAKIAIESIDEDLESETFLDNKNNSLWLWYHHASQNAFDLYQDREKAVDFINTALEYHKKINHPNKITQLLSFLYSNNFEGAQAYVQSIPDEDYEKTTALNLLETFQK